MERSAERIRIMCAVSCTSISIISVWNGPSRLLSCRFRILALLAPKMLATAASAPGSFFKMTLSRAVPPVELRSQLRSTQSASTPLSRVLQRSEEHTSELQSLMRISYAVFCLKKNTPLYTIQRTFLHYSHLFPSHLTLYS